MITNTHDLENDRTADEAADADQELENSRTAFAEALFEGYFNNNGAVIDWLDEELSDDPEMLLKVLRDNFTRDGQALHTVYMKHIAQLADRLAKAETTVKGIEVVCREYKL